MTGSDIKGKGEGKKGKGGGKGKIFYSLSVGVNPLGPATDPATLSKMDNQLQDVWDMFMNTTDAAAAAIDGNGGPNGANAAALADNAYVFFLWFRRSHKLLQIQSLTKKRSPGTNTR